MNDWRSWRTHGSRLTNGEKQQREDLMGTLVLCLFVALYVWAVFL